MNPAFLLGTAFNIAYWHRKYEDSKGKESYSWSNRWQKIKEDRKWKEKTIRISTDYGIKIGQQLVLPQQPWVHKKIPDSRTKPQIGNVHESGNEKIKIRKTTTPKEKKKMNLRKVEQEME